MVFPGTGRHTVVDLTPWSGSTVTLRRRLTCDGSVNRVGWWVDDITLHTHEVLFDAYACGVPGAVQLMDVSRSVDDVLLSWWDDPVCLDFRVWRSSDPSQAGYFVDVTGEDADPTDTSFLDTSGDPLLFFIVEGRGPDGYGPWGHFGQ